MLIVHLLKLALHTEFLRIMNYILTIKSCSYSSLLDGLQNWFAALTGTMTAHVAVWMITVLYLPIPVFYFLLFKTEIKSTGG